MDHKNIVICSDGTGNTTIKGRGTNVFKLFEAVDVNGHLANPALTRQLAFYDDGIGTQELRWIRAFAGATGYGLSRNVKRLYRELCRVYEPGDQIYLFGFSRGAFTVRTLAGLIADCGILAASDYPTEHDFRGQTRAAYKAYRRKYRAMLARLSPRRGITADEFKARYAKRDRDGKIIEARIRLLGVWDTVDAVGLPFRLADFWNSVIWQFKFRTTTISSLVDRACQALALNDDRGAFRPVLWDESNNKDGRIEQVWFAGAHSNVGGGYPRQEMSLVALDWMLTKAEEQGLRFTPFAREQYRSQQSFAGKLYNPRSGFGIFYRWQPRHVTELCAEAGIKVPKVHVSVIERIVQAPEGYAPGNLPPNCEIVSTKPNPQINLKAVAEAIANAHGPRPAPALIERQAAWVKVGFAAYLSFIIGIGGAVGHALWVMIAQAAAPPSLAEVDTLLDAFPFSLIVAVLSDSISFATLCTGLGLGYVLSNISDRRTNLVYSAFWHRHRDALRKALRRIPPAAADTATTTSTSEATVA